MNPTHVNEERQTTLPAGWREYRHLIFAGLFGCLAIALVALAAWLLGEPVAVFTREPQQVLDGSFYVGGFSNLGGLIWFGSAAILSFAASLKPFNGRALILAALVTWAMGLDDMYMLHDRVYPRLYLNEMVIYALYFGVIGMNVLRSHRQLARSTLVGIAIALLFWVLSAAFDRFCNNIGQLPEDGAKFFGIVLWAAAWTRQAYGDVSSLAHSST